MVKSNIVMVFSEGLCFVGEPVSGANILKNAMQRTLIPSNRGMVSMNQGIGDLSIDFKKYPHTEIKEKSQVWNEYIELTTGIKTETSILQR